MQKIDISPGQIFDGIHVRLLRVTTGAIATVTPTWRRCGYPEFILIRDGAVRSEFKEAPGRFLERPAHSIIHFPQDSVRRTSLAAGERAPFVSLAFSARSDLLFDLFGLLEIPDFIRSEEAEEIMCRIVPLAGSGSLADQLLVQELLLRFLRIVVTQSTIREEAARLCRERWFQEVAAWIDSESGGAFFPGELAKRCGMSRQSFYRKFKQATGMAPLEYIRRKRLREAELLLLDSDAGIGEIAEKLHFADPFHFSHLFKKVYGMSPLRFRRAGRERNRQLYRGGGRFI